MSSIENISIDVNSLSRYEFHILEESDDYLYVYR
jgi:hypothetical protein